MITDSFWNALGDLTSPQPEQAEAARQTVIAQGPDAVEPLCLSYRIGETPTRRAAIQALGHFAAPAAIACLLAALCDADTDVRGLAVESLVKIGAAAVEPLLATLRADDWSACSAQLRRLDDMPGVAPVLETLVTAQGSTRRLIIEILARIGDDRALETLTASLRDADEEIRRVSAQALARRGAAMLPTLLAALDSDLMFRQHVADALAANGEILGDAALPTLVLASRIGHVHVRWVADYVLSQIGSQTALDSLSHALTDPEVDVRLIAIEAVRQVNDINIEPLLTATRDASPLVRQAAVKVLADVTDPRVLAAMVQAANDEDPVVRSRALAAVGSLSNSREIQPLINALSNRDNALRKTAGAALSGMEAERVVPLLIAALNQDAYGEVARTLGHVGDKQAVEPLLNCLSDATYVSRQAIIEALGMLKDRRALNAFIYALKDDTSGVREAAVKALDRLAAPESITYLIEALNDAAPSVREGASQALTHLGPLVLQAMLPSLESSDWRVRLNAVQVLGNIGDVRAVELLIRKLKDPAGNVCGAAITELKRLADARCVGWLLKALEDRDAFVCESAADVLMGIGDSYTLPRIVLGEARLSPRDRAAILDYMRRVRYSDRHITFRFTAIGDVVAYCMQMRNDTDAAVQEGAKAVLDYIRQLRDAQAASGSVPQQAVVSQEPLPTPAKPTAATRA